MPENRDDPDSRLIALPVTRIAARSNDPGEPIFRLDSWLSAADGDASGLWFMSFLANITVPESFVWGEATATGMHDARFADAYYAAGGDPGSILGNPRTDFIWGGGTQSQGHCALERRGRNGEHLTP